MPEEKPEAFSGQEAPDACKVGKEDCLKHEVEKFGGLFCCD